MRREDRGRTTQLQQTLSLNATAQVGLVGHLVEGGIAEPVFRVGEGLDEVDG